MTNKTEITKILKDSGLENIKLYVDSHTNKPYKNFAGKMVKGIRGGSIGPMTVTNEHLNHNREVENQVKDALKELEYETCEDHSNGFKITIQINAKQNSEISFNWGLYPAYHPTRNLDSSYQNYWLVPTIKNIKR